MKSPRAASFSRRVKEELAHIRAPRECCRRSEMVGMVRGGGTLHILPGGRYALEVEAPDAAVARAVYSALSVLGGLPEVRQYSPGRAHPHERYVVRIESGEASLFSRAGALAADGLPATGVPRGVFERRCCAGAYLRAAFIVHGTVSPPRSATHLEIRAPDAGTAEGLTELGHMVGARLRVRDHRGHAVYTKDVSSVGALLAAMGAHQGCLEWEAGGVWATVRNEANRLANCDQANVRRTVRASLQQRDAIRRLDAEGRLDGLPSGLRDAARVRLEHPDASLDELAKELRISKSAMADRLRRLTALAG
ncbi:MAG TPA: DNA-binding protein WhiA [Actinomycetota bacterium]|nr:DNA-binding protein WhiA [Actinomycetota bacterium]